MGTMLIPAIVAVLVAAAAFLLVGFLSSHVFAKLADVIVDDERPKEKPYIVSVLGKLFMGRVPAWIEERAERMLLFAGRPYELAAHDIMGLKLISGIVGLWVGYMVANFMQWQWYVVLLTGLLATMVPWVWLRDQVLRRHMWIMKDLPFHIDLLTLSVEAGLDFSAAVAKMVEKGRPGPVRDEFRIMLSEIRVGKTRSDAMRAMAERVGLPALNSFLGVLIQADRLGTGIGKVLRLQADQMRIERSQRAEKQASEAPVKMLLPLVLFVFPTIWLILAAPLVFSWIFS